MVANLFTKKRLHRREARWLDILASFNIRQVNLVKEKEYVLGDALSRIPDRLHLQNMQSAMPLLSGFEISIGTYDNDQCFGPIAAALDGSWPADPKQGKRVDVLLPSFPKDGWRLLYKGKLCIPAHCRREIMQMAHDLPVGGHFAFLKTLARLAELHWKHKEKQVKQYCDGCSTCQQQKDLRGQALNDPTPLPVPTRRWGIIATDFIAKLPMTKSRFDSICTWVDRLSRRVRFVSCRETDQAPDIARVFFKHIFPHHALPDSLLSDRDPQFVSAFWRALMDLCGVHSRTSTAKHTQMDVFS